MKTQLLWQRAERSKDFVHVFYRGCLAKLHANGGHMTIGNIHAMTLSAYCHRSRLDASICCSTQNLCRLLFDLLFLVLDKWQNVVNNIERSHARVTSTRKRLHSRR